MKDELEKLNVITNYTDPDSIITQKKIIAISPRLKKLNQAQNQSFNILIFFLLILNFF